ADIDQVTVTNRDFMITRPSSPINEGACFMRTVASIALGTAPLMACVSSVNAQAWRNCTQNSIGPGGCESIGPGGGQSIGPGGGASIGPGGGLSIGPGGGQSIRPGGGLSIAPG